MKKTIVALLLAVLAISLATVTALADGGTATTNWAYGYTAQCVNISGLNNAGQFHTKKTSDSFIEVRSNVIGNGNAAGFTNLMYAYWQNNGYYGSKWQAPNGIYYSCTSASLAKKDLNVTPGGRGNTKYNEQLSLTSVRLEGQFRTH